MKSADKLPLYHYDFENHENICRSDIASKHHPKAGVIHSNFCSVDINKGSSPAKCTTDISDAMKENKRSNIEQNSSLNTQRNLRLKTGFDSKENYVEQKSSSYYARPSGINALLKANMTVMSQPLTESSAVLDLSSLNIPPHKNIPIAPFCNFQGFDSDAEDETGITRLCLDEIDIVDVEDNKIIDGKTSISWRLSHAFRTIFQLLIAKGEHERPHLWFKSKKSNRSKVSNNIYKSM